MELKLVKTEKFNSNQTKLATREYYEIGGYNVIADTYTYESDYKIVSTKQKGDIEYLPSIYELHNFGVLCGFEISTVSYGSLPVEDIKEIIKGYEQAIEVVEILTEKFINT